MNAGQFAFVRVRYSEALHGQLLAAIKCTRDVPTEDRLGLAVDTFALADSGHHSAALALHLLQAYAEEDQFPVLQEMATWLRAKVTHIHRTPKNTRIAEN